MTQPNLKSARAVADVTTGTLLASVEIMAPKERVFHALASSDITQWWGSKDTYQTTRWVGDVRVGGAWLAEGVGQDGSRFSVRGEFLEVDPPHKLVQTWRAQWDGDRETTLTYLLEAVEFGTRVTLRHEGFGDRAQSCRRHAEGWELVLNWVRDHLTRNT